MTVADAEGNRLKLGVFAANLDGGVTASTAPERHRLSWPTCAEIATRADQAGFELQAPLARWRPLGGVTNFNGINYEGLAWAAGVSAITRQSNVFATIHVPVIHPLVAAKQMTTIDHISGGRFGLNLVCGWFAEEFAMFGSPMMSHEDRYGYAAEWLEVVKRLWTAEEEFDFEGRFFKIEKGWHQPKPIRKPHPPIMQAGTSETGARFAAKYADIAFQSISIDEPIEQVKGRFADLRRLGLDEFGRRFEIWSGAWVICRPTEREALEFMDYCLGEHGDEAILDVLPPGVIPEPGTVPPEVLKKIRFKMLGGWGGAHLVGTPEQIVDRLKTFADAGADGVMLSWVDYVEGVDTWTREVMPLMEQAGLRRPAARQPV